MVLPTAGTVVVLPFPFSDLSGSKLRPALVLTEAGFDDWLVCQITSNPYSDLWSIPLVSADFRDGGLRSSSYARPSKLVTIHRDVMVSRAGALRPEILARIVNMGIDFLRSAGKGPPP